MIDRDRRKQRGSAFVTLDGHDSMDKVVIWKYHTASDHSVKEEKRSGNRR